MGFQWHHRARSAENAIPSGAKSCDVSGRFYGTVKIPLISAVICSALVTFGSFFSPAGGGIIQKSRNCPTKQDNHRQSVIADMINDPGRLPWGRANRLLLHW
jgi:hypothetical protein